MSSFIKTLLYFLAVSLLIPSAEAGWMDTKGNNIPDTEFMKSSGNLVTRLVVTDNEKLLLKNWNIPSKSVYLPITNITKRNKVVSVFVVFGGCEKDSKGNCDLRMKINIYKPDGSLYSKIPEMDLWSHKVPPIGEKLGLSHGYIRVKFEDNEPLGKYKLEALINDYVSFRRMTLTSFLTVTK